MTPWRSSVPSPVLPAVPQGTRLTLAVSSDVRAPPVFLRDTRVPPAAPQDTWRPHALRQDDGTKFMFWSNHQHRPLLVRFLQSFCCFQNNLLKLYFGIDNESVRSLKSLTSVSRCLRSFEIWHDIFITHLSSCTYAYETHSINTWSPDL